MIRTLLATTAIATLLSTGAFAQTTAPATTDPATAPATEAAPADAAETPGPEPVEGHLASNIIGEDVYNGVADDAESIGTVNDIVLGADGQAALVVVGVGGFLGLGEKDVALEYESLEWAQREDGSTWLIASTTREQLEQQEAFDRDAYDPDDADSMAATGAATGGAAATATAPADDDAADTAGEMADDAGDSIAETADDAEDAMTDDTAATDDAAQTDGMAAAPADGEDDAAMTDDTAMDDDAAAADGTATAAIDRTTLTEVDAAGLSADDLIGTTVYGANDENVGSIEDVILDGDTVDVVTLEVGGFLGLGDKEVAVSMENLAFMTDEDGELYLYTSFTEEQLEAQPEYDEATFAEARDEQLLISPAN
ncbi:PRC-barrel domain-containing protein [Aliihoeflea sp. 40Bstr573]|uniref:PRC-barrel domain-containing protein n=1 Tax=Aliihoeflea sp. 40Bstr573 TaxID=2696467 RepID=UPI00209441B3|nr:PRC-barrel domain-containing protein [Aliihoeflea sp. 40Bstr573]MCO6386318.1 PRC-barrel domain containing protein [Aliihoeflea sp. 40Bstr573]